MSWILVLGLACAQAHPPDGDSFGAAFCEIGDLDGDGTSDLLIGDPLRGPGRILVVSPKTGARIAEKVGAVRGDRFGASVLAPGDLDGDGVPDYLVGSAGGPERSAERTACHVTAFSGKDRSDGKELHSIEVPPDTLAYDYETHLGPAPVLCAVGDVNLDGVPDYAVGSKLDATAGAEAGAVRVFSGDDGRLLREILGSRSGERFGASLAAGHLIAPTGVRDLVVGSVAEKHYGFDEQPSGVSVVSLADGMRKRTHPPLPGGFGFAVCALSDLDGDGCDEYAVSQPFDFAARRPVRCYSGRTGAELHAWTLSGNEVPGPSRAGRGEKFCGAALAPWRGGKGVLISYAEGSNPVVWGLSFAERGAPVETVFQPEYWADNFGSTVCEIADCNGDGQRDVAIGAACYWLAGGWCFSEVQIRCGRTGEEIGRLHSD